MEKDPDDAKSSNRVRREERIKSLTEAMEDPRRMLSRLIGLRYLEKRGSYICAYIIQNLIEGDYERVNMHGDIDEERDRVGLFFAERDCIEARNGSNMDSAIPVIKFVGEEVIECTVIDTSKLSHEDRALMEANYEVSINALSDIE